VAPNPAQRCKALSAQLEVLCAVLLCAEIAILVAVASGGRAIAASAVLPWPVTGALWLLWLATLVQNDRLVRCGSQATRLRFADRLVNRSGTALRLAFHVLINWSALLVTVAVAAQLQPGPARTAIARACVVAAAAVWLYFNLLHRQHDRARNLLLTTTFAAAVAIAATLILRQAP